MEKQKQAIYMIGHAHLDPVWLWRWQEGFQEIKATFRSALDRMNEYKDFKFTASSAAFYEWIESNDPSMFEEIKSRVQEGRWEIAGGWWVEPDCNIPSGESFVRQALYGQRYFKEKFGKISKVGFNPDSFGHNAMLPQLLKKCGLEYYVFMRPMANEKDLPEHLFWWKSDDGSRILTFRIPYEYLSWGKELKKHIQRSADELSDQLNGIMCFYGVGNHGGGPTKLNIQSIQQENKEPVLPDLRFSTMENYFSRIENHDNFIPTVHDELQHHAIGCYSAHSGVKKWNRQIENILIKSEKFSTAASLHLGIPYPRDFQRGWKNLLFNQFHDILAGTSIESAYDDAVFLYGEAAAISERNMNNALQSLSWNINIPEEQEMKPLVVFNPHSWNDNFNVEIESAKLENDIVLKDDKGKEIPIQLIQSEATAEGRCRISFTAELPSLGYRLYRLYTGLKGGNSENSLEVTGSFFENKRYRLEFDRETGFIKSLYDKKNEIEFFDGDAAIPVVLNDASDTWSHELTHYNDIIGSFKLDDISVVENGSVKAVIRAKSSYSSSVLYQDFTIYSELPGIDVKVRINWREHQKLLKIRFPVNRNFSKATSEIPYGHIVRSVTGKEVPGQSWLDLSGEIPLKGKMYGICFLNDGKYSYDVNNNEVSLTVLRSPAFAHHDPQKLESDKLYSFIDEGFQTFTYSLLPHEDSWESGGTIKKAMALNQRAVALFESFHKGNLPGEISFMDIDRNNIIMSTLKKAEDGNGVILRCYETDKIETEVIIKFPQWDREITSTFGPCEIKTFRIPSDINQPVKECDMLEFI